MIKDYKGEMPNNVITKEEHQKRPFFKKASFWILSALGLFFGACTIYGLVLGYQYVEAVRDAAHIIADAQSGSVADSGNLFASKNPLNAVGASQVTFVDLGSLDYTYVFNQHGRFTAHIPNIALSTSDNLAVEAVCTLFKPVSYNGAWDVGFMSYRYSFTTADANKDMVVFLNDDYSNVTDFKSYVNGVYLYYKTNDSFTGLGAYQQGVQDGHETGYDEGHQDGYQDGYQEGYDDGYQALAGVQNIRILFDENFPTLKPINYSWKVDGTDVASGQIMLRPNQSAPVVNLTRPGGYTHTATLNIWSENDQPLIIAYGRHEGLVIGGTQTYIYDTFNKSNAYDWANSVWYVPTYNPNAGFVIYSYGTAQQGYTNDYFFEFDPEHNDRAKTGIYADGYDQGYKDGTESGTAYDNGHQDGYAQGYEDGLTIGKAQGEAQAVGGQKALVTMFVTAFQQPFDQIYRFLNFNVLGLNILALFTALLTLSIGIIIIKKVI